jgi:hypothetical protein
MPVGVAASRGGYRSPSGSFVRVRGTRPGADTGAGLPIVDTIVVGQEVANVNQLTLTKSAGWPLLNVR